jgi:hypothetical protein
MKRLLLKIVTICILVIYSVFSTGIALVVHHCCASCSIKKQAESCCCLNEQTHCIDSKYKACHVEHYFFKITDTHQKSDVLTIHDQTFTAETVLDPCSEECESMVVNRIVKQYNNSPPDALVRGRSFLNIVHQLKINC